MLCCRGGEADALLSVEGCKHIRCCCHIDRLYADMITGRCSIRYAYPYKRRDTFYIVRYNRQTMNRLLRQNELVMTSAKTMLLAAMRMTRKQKKHVVISYRSGSQGRERHALMVYCRGLRREVTHYGSLEAWSSIPCALGSTGGGYEAECSTNERKR